MVSTFGNLFATVSINLINIWPLLYKPYKPLLSRIRSVKPAMKILVVRLRSLFDFFDRHLHPQRFQLSDQALALRVHVTALEILTP